MKLQKMPDYMTSGVEELLEKTKECVSATKGIMPMLVYIVNGIEYSFPLHYDTFIEIGLTIRSGCVASAICAHTMGTDFAFLAMTMSERSVDPRASAEDRASLMHDVQHILFHMKPWCFYISMPIRVVAGVFQEHEIPDLLKRGPYHPQAKNALFVIGRNPIRTFGIITPFSHDQKGEFVYEDGQVIDSFDNHQHEEGIFSNVYYPRLN